MPPMQQRETLSAYMDGHHINGEFTDTLCRSPELQQKWADYHKVRSLMRGEPQLLGEDFSAKLEALLENEVIEVATTPTQKRGLLLQLKRWRNPIMQAGIAASVCLVAVVSVNMFNRNDEVATIEAPKLQTLPFSHSVQQVSYNAPVQQQPTQEQLEYQQRRINALLQNHELQRRTTTNSVILSEAEKAKAQTSATQPPKQEQVSPQQQQ